MLKIVSIHADRVDARQLVCIHRMTDVSLTYTYAIGLLITINGQNVRVAIELHHQTISVLMTSLTMTSLTAG